MEHVSAMPGQGVTSMFNFGQSFWVKRVFVPQCNFQFILLDQQNGKSTFNLINTAKDASRSRAIEIFQSLR